MRSNNTILVVDDDPLLLSGTARLLQDAGYSVMEADNGFQAIQDARNHIPDLMLLDIELPDISGLEICQRLKKENETSGIYICLISGKRIHSSEQSEGLEIGADDYIARPIDNRQLLARLKAMVRLINAEKAIAKHRDELEILVDQRTSELIASEKKYRSLINEMGNGFALHEIICDDDDKPCDYRFLEVNRAFEKITNLQAKDIIGKTVLEVLPKTESYWIDMYGKVAVSGKPVRFEEFSTELGEYFETLAYSPKEGQFAVVFTNITERRVAHERLKKSEARFRNILVITHKSAFL